MAFNTGHLAYLRTPGLTDTYSLQWATNNNFALPNDSRGEFFPGPCASGDVGTSTPRPVDLTVNGSAAGSVNFGTTANWDTWANSTVTVTLSSGTNIIRVTSSTANGGPNLDRVEVS